MGVLLLAEVVNGHLATDSTAKALMAVKPLGDVTVLIAGTGGDAAAAEAAGLEGVTKVIFADAHVYCHAMSEPTAALVVMRPPSRARGGRKRGRAGRETSRGAPGDRPRR